MSEMLRSMRRGWDIMLAAAGPLLATGALWTVLNEITAWLLVGPALVGLFTIAFRAHEGRRVSITDGFAAFDDVASPLAAGFVFWAPFALWGALAEGLGGVRVALTLALAVHFAYFIHAFAVLADRPRGPMAAFGAAIRLGEPGADGDTGRTGAAARHLAFGTVIFVALSVLWRIAPFDFPVLLIVGGPLAVCMLTAWHAQRLNPPQRDAEGGGEAADAAEAPPALRGRGVTASDEAEVTTPRRRKKAASRKKATARDRPARKKPASRDDVAED